MKVLDTDTCVEILRGNDAVVTRRAEQREDVSTTWITAAELYYGAAKSRAPEPNRALVGEFLRSLAVLELEARAAECFGTLKHRLELDGRRLADADLLIAAIALAHDAALVTGNLRHYDRISELRTENWIAR